VVALQYYNACLVLIRQHKPPDHFLQGFEAVKERRNNEVKPLVPIEEAPTLTQIKRSLTKALGNVVGLADSNRWVENANFTAHHMLMNSS
jgi:hypothetical protein